MDESQDKFEQFMQNVMQRPLPDHPMTRVQTMAKEMAEGAVERLWLPSLRFTGAMHPSRLIEEVARRVDQNPHLPLSSSTHIALGLQEEEGVKKFLKYVAFRWKLDYPDLELLAVNGYISMPSGTSFSILKPAFDLLTEAEPSTIFISYRRKDSSAFALLILKSLKERRLNAFLDMALIPGENWHAELEKRVKAYDYLIALIGRDTLKSEVCLREIGWALEAGLTIIPVWHNGFNFQANKWGIPAEIGHLLATTHAIAVKEESASGYNTAIVELLNLFGVTP